MRFPLAFVIHELKPWGGHDRSTLEVVRRLSHQWPVDIVSFLLVDPKLKEKRDSWGSFHFQAIRPYLTKPALLGQTIFYFMTWIRLSFFPRLRGQARPLVHATGACSFVSDVVQVQFVNAAWLKKQREIGGSLARRSLLRRAYHHVVTKYNIASEKIAYRHDKTYIAIARCVADELREHFGLTENVHVIHHGVDSETFRPASSPADEERQKIRRELGMVNGEIAIGFVGEFERKGLAVSIDAIALLPPPLQKRVKLVAIGDSRRNAFRVRAHQHGIADRVVLVPLQKEIAKYYRALDLFLMPTLYEPFGLVILEAMASGLPTIVSKIAGSAELIEDGVSGKLIQDPTDAKEISTLVAWMLSDDQRRVQMGRAAREVAAKRSWDQVAREYAAVIHPLLEKKNEG